MSPIFMRRFSPNAEAAATDLSLLRRYRPSALAAFYLTQPVFGVVAATRMAGDRLTPEPIVASVAVTVGIWVTGR
jgi:drug/metabolite transporter (DMT)-like permease